MKIGLWNPVAAEDSFERSVSGKTDKDTGSLFFQVKAR
jgi:hypothetical protein